MINASPIATTTQEDVVPTSTYVWYKGYEGTGTTITDEAGNGPVSTVNGTLTNLWDNSGWLTLNATDIDVLVGADAEVDSILNLSTLTNGQQIIISFDQYFDGAIAANQAFLSWGENNTTSGWVLSTNNAEQFLLQIRGLGAASVIATTMPTYNFAALGTQRNTFTFEIIGRGSNTCDVNLYVNGGTTAVSSETAIDMNGSGTAPPSDAAGRGATLFARRTTGTTTDRWLEGRMSNIFMIRRTSEDTTLAIECNKEFYAKQGDLPTALDGK